MGRIMARNTSTNHMESMKGVKSLKFKDKESSIDKIIHKIEISISKHINYNVANRQYKIYTQWDHKIIVK